MSETAMNAVAATPAKKRWPGPVRILICVVLIGAALVAILLAVIVVPDQIGPPTQPQPPPVLSEAVRAVLESSKEKSAGRDASDNGTSGTTTEAREGAGPGERGTAAEKDPRVEALIQGLLPIQDLSSVREDKREAARRLNEKVGQGIAETVALLEESPSMPTQPAFERFSAIWQDLPGWYRESMKDVEDPSAGIERARQMQALNEFMARAMVQISVEHQEYANVGMLCWTLGDWDSAKYYLRQSGWQGRIALAGLSVYLRFKQMGDPVAKKEADHEEGSDLIINHSAR